MSDVIIMLAIFIGLIIFYILYDIVISILYKIICFLGSFLSENIRKKIKIIFLWIIAGGVSSIVVMILTGNRDLSGIFGIIVLIVSTLLG